MLSALHAGRTLSPGFFIFKDSWYSFLLEAESTPGPVRPEGLGQFNNPPHRNANPRPSGLQQSIKTLNMFNHQKQQMCLSINLKSTIHVSTFKGSSSGVR
jgi:hypothetical protein